ncbi:FMNL1 isoform 12, partial [Pongo abelii]
RQDDCMVLKEFLRANSPTMDKLLADSKTAQKAEQEVEQWKKEAAAQEAGADSPGKGEPPAPKSPPKARRPQMDLISELKRRQQKEPLIYESDRDGAIEDIITGKGLARPSSYPQSVLLCFLLTQSPTLWGTGYHTASCYLFCFSFLFPFST